MTAPMHRTMQTFEPYWHLHAAFKKADMYDMMINGFVERGAQGQPLDVVGKGQAVMFTIALLIKAYLHHELNMTLPAESLQPQNEEAVAQSRARSSTRSSWPHGRRLPCVLHHCVQSAVDRFDFKPLASLGIDAL